jgi:16S rRNA processing protein RimM
MILLAVIGSAHGIRGAVKVKTFTENPRSILSYGALRDETGKEYSLKFLRLAPPDCLIVTIEGVGDRTQAETMRGTKLYVERDQLPDLVEEEFYHSDLIGLMVHDLAGQEIGRLKAISNFGAGDFLEIVDATYHLYTIPFTKVAVPSIQLPTKESEGVIQIDRSFLLDSTLSQETDGEDE